MYVAAIDPLTPEQAPVPANDAWADVAKGLTTVATAYYGFRSQRELIKENERRMKAGLPLLDMNALAPTVKVEHDVAGFNLKGLVPVIAVGALAWFLLRR